MPISIACPHCDWTGKVKDDLAGKNGKCPTCGEVVPIPKRSAPPPVRGKKAADPDVVDDANIFDDTQVVEDEPRPKSKRPARRDDEDDRPPRSHRRTDDEDDDDRLRKSRRLRDDDDDDDDYRPRKARRLRDEEDDDRPRKRRRPSRRAVPRQTSGSKKSLAILGGIGLILLGIGLFVVFLLALNRIWIYPLILSIGGGVSVFRGMSADSGGDDDDDY